MSLPCQASVMPSRGTAVTCNDAPQITNYNCRNLHMLMRRSA